jgi:uncharacterized membrane protein
MNFDEIQPNRELRAYARAQLNGVWGKMAFTFFILWLIYLPVNFFSTLTSINNYFKLIGPYLYLFGLDTPDFLPSFPVITNVLLIAVILSSGPFALGFTGYFLKRVRGQEIATKNIFDGFQRFLPSFLVFFFTVLFSALWSLLLIIPGIIKMYGYSMAFYIMHDNPEIKPLGAIKKSQIMMKGYKWKLFLLQLSFIGWALLCSIFSFGIGYFWLSPYVGLSTANFYENLKKNQENKAATEAKTPVDPFRSV